MEYVSHMLCHFEVISRLGKRKTDSKRETFLKRIRLTRKFQLNQKKFKGTTQFVECYHLENLRSKYILRFDKNNELHSKTKQSCITSFV